MNSPCKHEPLAGSFSIKKCKIFFSRIPRLPALPPSWRRRRPRRRAWSAASTKRSKRTKSWRQFVMNSSPKLETLESRPSHTSHSKFVASWEISFNLVRPLESFSKSSTFHNLDPSMWKIKNYKKFGHKVVSVLAQTYVLTFKFYIFMV